VNKKAEFWFKLTIQTLPNKFINHRLFSQPLKFKTNQSIGREEEWISRRQQSEAIKLQSK
jgi:hypothetical protein